MDERKIVREEVDVAQNQKRDYRLIGLSAEAAVASGLAAAQWYHSEIDRKTMKALMQRSDNAAIRDTALWLGLMAMFAVGLPPRS